MEKAARGHRGKPEVKRMMEEKDAYADMLLHDIADGSYVKNLQYRRLEKTNANGKRRKLLSPSLYTRVLQTIFVLNVTPIYDKHDPLIALNCKEGCGITTKERKRSVVRRMKHLVYDRTDLKYGMLCDQRKCYEHIKVKVFRKKLKRLIEDKRLIDFYVNVVFTPDGEFPIGTPSSPLAHHIIMLDMDCMVHSMAPVVLRYADNYFLAAQTAEELQRAKWRLRNWWWYDLGLRMKRHDVSLFPMTQSIDFCGYVFHRNGDKTITSHDKGYTTIRKSTEKRARKSDSKAWPSYYGMLSHADAFGLITKIERNMKLQELSSRKRIDRKMDARKIEVKELAENNTVFTIYDYEIRRNGDGVANWIKCLIGIPETKDGQPTGKIQAREFHGNYSCLIQSMELWEKEFGKSNILPIEEAEIENQCGYIFKGSTNQLTYIDDDYKQSNGS